MTKSEAIYNFWAQFGIPAYDESTVPDDAPLPYITYSVITDSIGNVCRTSASIWDESYSWKYVSNMTNAISRTIAEMYPPTIAIDGGRLYVTMGTPFAQRMREDSNDKIRRVRLNVDFEFLTAY